MEKIKLDFMVDPVFLTDDTEIDNPVKIRLLTTEHPIVKRILGQSGKRMANAGAAFYFTKEMAEELIDNKVAIRVD